MLAGVIKKERNDMRSESKKIGENLYQIMRVDRGEYDLVHDEESHGWYIETIVNGITMKSEIYPHAQAAEDALKKLQQK